MKKEFIEVSALKSLEKDELVNAIEEAGVELTEIQKTMLSGFSEEKIDHIDITGIKCNNPECDYELDNIPLEEFKNFLNKPCPLCGTTLLNEEELNTVKIWYAIKAIAYKLDK